MGCFKTHASGTLDPPEVRNWRIHLIALIASMSALASQFTSLKNGDLGTDYRTSGLRYCSYWRDYGT